MQHNSNKQSHTYLLASFLLINYQTIKTQSLSHQILAQPQNP